MLKQLTYKKKNLVLISGIALFALIVYFLAIGKTVDLYFQCNELKEQLEFSNNASEQLNLLQKQMNEIDGVFESNSELNKNYQQGLLENISNYCNQTSVILREFPTQIILNERDFSVETNLVVVEGSFTNLLKLVYMLEQKNKTGKVSSLLFNSKKDYKTKQLTLTASIYIQNIKKK
ncbi:MAG: hypothetical protein H0V01_04410 [Bacteroidetes bacterium]|nr:hypothetical protein [Bacteroidota bacterium]HET6243894.1 hypothetical protein [Bacteroidia bacterium]